MTITGGYFDVGSAVIVGDGQPVEIDNCIFADNVGTGFGGAVVVGIAAPVFTNCVFMGNQAVTGGAIAAMSESSLQLENCVFIDNDALNGGAIYYMYASSTSVVGCTFNGNTAPVGSAVSVITSTYEPLVMENCIVSFGVGGEGIYWDAEGTLTLTCVDIYGNEGGDWVGAIADQAGTGGNLNADPLFCGDANPDLPLSLTAGSPCAPDANPDCGLIGAYPVGCDASIGVEQPPLAAGFRLRPSYPNPFNPTTTLEFELAVAAEVSLAVHDVRGTRIRELVKGFYPAGVHSTVWHGRDLRGRAVGSGVYFAHLLVNGDRDIQKLVLLR